MLPSGAGILQEVSRESRSPLPPPRNVGGKQEEGEAPAGVGRISAGPAPGSAAWRWLEGNAAGKHLAVAMPEAGENSLFIFLYLNYFSYSFSFLSQFSLF